MSQRLLEAPDPFDTGTHTKTLKHIPFSCGSRLPHSVMERSSVRRLLPHGGEERHQMLELNRRLESYLGHVKLLEEENHFLREEIQALQSRDTKSQRQAQEEALSLARKEVQVAWMEKDCMELEIGNLMQEMEALNAQRQQERAAQTEVKKKLTENKKKLEDEWRTQIWLREQAAYLEKEITLQVEVHQEEMASLKSTSALTKPVLKAPQHSQTINLQGLGEEYSQKVAHAWQEAAGVYQRQVEELEDSLNQTRAHVAQISQEKKENQLYVQDLTKELESTKTKREMLEKKFAQQRNTHYQELQQLQAQVEDLESDKGNLGQHINNMLIDTRELLQMKMRLGLEVATYRALLDSESMRVNSKPTSKASSRTVSLPEVFPKLHGIYPGTQPISASSQLSSPLTKTSKPNTYSTNLMTTIQSWSLAQSTHETLKRKPEKKEDGIGDGSTKLERLPTAISKRPLTEPESVPLTLEEDHEEVTLTPAVSTSEVPQVVDNPESIPSAHFKEDLHDILTEKQSKTGQETSDTDEAALISLPAGNLSSLLQTPEREVPSNLHAEDAKSSEDGEEEETEVSTEMAQISHAPMFAWEENDTAIQEESYGVSELELESEDISENYTQDLTDLKQLGESTSPLFDQASMSSIDAFIYSEKKSETLTDVKESIIPEDKAFGSALETEKVLIERWQGMEQTEEIEDEAKVGHCGIEVKESPHSDVELREEEEENDSKTEDRKVEDRKEVEVAEGDEEETMKEEDIAVIEKSFTNNGEDSSASEVKFEPHRSLETTKQTAELVMETDDKDHTLDEVYAEEQILRKQKQSEMLTWADMKESGINALEAETLGNALEIEKVSIERFQGMDKTEEMEDEAEVENCGTEVKEGPQSDVELQEKEKENCSKTEDRKVEATDGYSEESIVEEGVAVIDDSVANTGIEGMVQDSSASELKVDPHRNLEPVKQTSELVAETHDEDHTLDEDNAEEQMLSDDESLNISASWRTDPGEADSYAQENTLADTRPLIHYKSDEETDANTQASHMGASEPSDSEDEKHDGVLMWGQNTSKHFDTMEDLSEEPEMANSDDVVMEDSVQTVVEGNIGEIILEESTEPMDEDLLQSESDEIDINVNTLKDDALLDFAENTFKNCEESNQDGEETENEISHAPLVQKQEETSPIQDWGNSFLSETRDTNEQPNSNENNIAITNENCDSFMQIKSDGEDEGGVKTHLDYFPLVTETSLPEPFQEGALAEEVPPTTHSDAIALETNMIEEQACTKEDDDEQSNVSMLTHADFTDNLSLNSGPNSRPDSNIAKSDSEDSSEDESPNASQCSQLHSHAGISTELLDISNEFTTVEASKNDLVPFSDLLEEVMKERFEEDSFENDHASKKAEWEKLGSENKNEQQSAMGITEKDGIASSLFERQQLEDLVHPDIIRGAFHNTSSSVEKANDITTENKETPEKIDIFQGNVLNEEPQQMTKENDLHSFFSSGLKEGIWGTTHFEMAATYASNESADTDRDSPDTIHPNQNMALKGDWGEMESLKPTNGKHEKERSISPAQSEEEEEEEEEREKQKILQAKQLQCREVKDGQVETAQSDDSIDDGDSWSSGEE